MEITRNYSIMIGTPSGNEEEVSIVKKQSMNGIGCIHLELVYFLEINTGKPIVFLRLAIHKQF